MSELIQWGADLVMGPDPMGSRHVMGTVTLCCPFTVLTYLLKGKDNVRF